MWKWYRIIMLLLAEFVTFPPGLCQQLINFLDFLLPSLVLVTKQIALFY